MEPRVEVATLHQLTSTSCLLFFIVRQVILSVTLKTVAQCMTKMRTRVHWGQLLTERLLILFYLYCNYYFLFFLLKEIMCTRIANPAGEIIFSEYFLFGCFIVIDCFDVRPPATMQLSVVTAQHPRPLDPLPIYCSSGTFHNIFNTF